MRKSYLARENSIMLPVAKAASGESSAAICALFPQHRISRRRQAPELHVLVLSKQLAICFIAGNATSQETMSCPKAKRALAQLCQCHGDANVGCLHCFNLASACSSKPSHAGPGSYDAQSIGMIRRNMQHFLSVSKRRHE